MLPLPLAGGVFLGWALGANDAANVFGTAVAARVISFRKAALLCGVFVLLGAWLQGEAGLLTYRDLAVQDLTTVVIAALSAAFTVTYMTVRGLPISTSQAMVGAITGIGLATHTVNWGGLLKVVICWIATPLGSLLIAVFLYYLIGWLLNRIPMSLLTRDKLLWSGLLLTGLYGAYALGANNVANATGIFSGQFPGITNQHLVLLGGASIALGTWTFGKRVMMTVGSGILPLDAFTALVAVASMSITVHIFAVVGVPVSTSQGIVGAILGIGIVRRSGSLRLGALRRIGMGWLLTPAIALVLAAAGCSIFH